MRKLTRLFSLAILTGLLGAAENSFAQAASTNAPPATTAPHVRSKTVSGTVTKLDNDAKTLTLKGHDKPFGITSKTRITKDGEPATLSDIAVGDHVSLRAHDDENGNPIATIIRDGKPKPKAEAVTETPPTPSTSSTNK